MDFNPVSPDIIKFEMRGMGGDPAATQEKRKSGGFGRFLSGFFKLLAAPLMVAGAVAPPLLIAGLGAQALASTGDAMQARAASKDAQRAAPPPQQYFFPGVDTGAMAEASSSLSPSTLPVPTALRQSVTDVIYARSDARGDAVQSFREGKEVANV
jgi:hypothetical protein